MERIQLWGEAGINHNGHLDLAFKLCDIAKESGCDVVKFQCRFPEVSTPKDQWYVKKEWEGEILDYIAYRHKVEFGKLEYDAIDRHCCEIGIRWTASVWDCESLEFLMQYDVPFVKVPSAHLVNDLLVDRVVACGKPFVLSTGMSTEQEIRNVIENVPYIDGSFLMHCTSTYPARDETLNLAYMKSLRGYGFPVGFSSHSDSPYPAIVAGAMGAVAIEQHFTIDRSMPGSDHAASLEQKGLSLLRRELDRIPIIVGDGVKRVYDEELKIRKKLRGV